NGWLRLLSLGLFDPHRMNIAQELERLAKLHADGTLSDEEFAKAKNRLLSVPPLSRVPFKGIRRQSSRIVCGLPLWAIAIGPVLERGELSRHARALFATGDMATGRLACDCCARCSLSLGCLA